jgi:penicillin-binding protein 1A
VAANRKIAILGAGRIGESLLAGLLSSGWRKPGDITVTGRREERLKELTESYGVKATLSNPEAALNRRNLVLRRMEEEGKITPVEEASTIKSPLGLHIQYPRNDLAPYFFEDIRKYLEATYGTEAVHERGLRVYTTLNLNMQRIANQSLRDGLHAYERRHGWKGNLPNVVRDNLGKLDTYEDEDWRHSIEKGSYVTGVVLSMDEKNAVVKIGPYRAILSPGDLAWTGRKKPAELLKIGDLAQFSIQELRDNTARVQLEQQTGPQAAILAIDNSTGEIKAMVGGYSFEDSKFNRATQAVRQVGSSFKIYVYADALEKGSTPFDTIVDLPFTTVSGGQAYSPRNYDEKFEGTITLRRALAGSRNVPAVKLAEKVGISTVVDMTRRFGITTPLPPYLPLALGAADMKLVEHVSAFTVFPNDGIRIDPHMIRRVTSYDGALLEEAHPEVHDVLSPDVARTMTAMLEEVIQFGTGIQAKALGRPAGAIHRLDLPQPRLDGDRIIGEVLRVDRFGNLITNIDRRTFDRLAGGTIEIQVGDRVVSKVVSAYTDAAAGELCALFGSTDHLEIAANGASAAGDLHLARGASVQIARRA